MVKKHPSALSSILMFLGLLVQGDVASFLASQLRQSYLIHVRLRICDGFCLSHPETSDTLCFVDCAALRASEAEQVKCADVIFR